MSFTSTTTNLCFDSDEIVESSYETKTLEKGKNHSNFQRSPVPNTIYSQNKNNYTNILQAISSSKNKNANNNLISKTCDGLNGYCSDDENEVNFLCGMCRKWFSNKASMTFHFLGHFADCPSCKTCKETFIEPQDYADHCIKHVVYTCFICEKSFFKEKDFEEHKLVHNLVCFKCKKTFHSENDLQAHYPVHEEIVNVRCDVCHKYYSTKRSLRSHMASQHSLNAKWYFCDLCTDRFTSSGNLDRHVQIFHSNLKPYVCHLCGKEYSIKGSLTTHLLHHKGEKPYTCLVCCHSFADVRQFKRHGVEHITKESDPCEICGKVFQTAMRLKIHFRSHMNQGRFLCSVCNRKFNYSSHLKRHKMAHENLRPFDCEVCGSCFIERSELRRHLKAKHAFDSEKIKKAIAYILNNMKAVKDKTLLNEEDSESEVDTVMED